MDVKSLRHRKRQKRVKTDSANGTGDVLVVPPDILKKLGIRIDNQISNTINIAQTTDTVNNESTVIVPTSNIIKKSSETSCLETANLMKKSVFLSPSFVPTLANLSTGEVEISNIHNNDDSKMATEIFPLGSMKAKSDNCNISTSDSDMAVCHPISAIHNIKTIIEATSEENLNEDNIIQIDPKITSDDCVKELVKLIIHDSKSIENSKKVVETHIDTEFALTALIQNTSILGNSINHIKKTVVDNDLIALKNTDIQLNEINGDNFSISTLGSTNNDVNVAINPLERIIIESENFEIEKHFSSLQGTEIQQEPIEPELNKYPLEKSGNTQKLTEIQNNFFVVEKTLTKTELDEAENNLISLGGIQFELTDVESDIICLREIDLKQSDYELNSTPLIKRGNTKKETEMQNNICPEEEKVTETELDEAENNLISLEGIQIELADVECDMICLRDIDLKQSESDIVFLKDIPIQNESAVDETNIFSSEGNTVQLLKNQKIIFPLENETVSLENCTKTLLLKDNKIEAFSELETNPPSDNKVNDIVNTLVNDNDNSQILGSENVVKSDMKQISNITIVCNGSIETKTQYNGNLKDTKLIDLDVNSSETILDKVAPVNNFIQKISIISEEIIPPSNLKELRNTHSPVNFSLTPVTLHSIIAPKRTKNNASETTVIGKIDPIVLPNVIEVQPLETKVGNNSNSPLPQKKIAPVDIGETNNEQSENSFEVIVATKYNSKKTKHKDISYMPLIDKGDLKNNNDIFNSIVVDSSNIKCKEDLLESSTTKYVPILNEDFVTENNKKNCDKISSDSNITTVDNFCKKINKVEYESTVIKKEPRIQNSLDKKKKKKKKAKESQTIGVTENVIIEDKEFYKKQLEDIVKSTKENSDTNAVKEIADCIKNFYKDKREINKNDKKNRIHTKSNMTKSKLCIQGVEKPGGYENKTEIPGGINILKTYTRQKKNKIPCTSELITANHKMECEIYDATETDFNTVNISMSYKQQDFCLCYDFGRLDASDYDNSYEHIHFCLHNDTTDLDSILSIYNDEEDIYNDRTKLDDVQITEDTESNTKTSNICWNYFMRNKEETNTLQSKKNNVISDSDKDIVSDHQAEENDSLVKNHDIVSKIGVPANIAEQYKNVNKIEAVNNNIDSSTTELLDIPLIGDSDDTYEVITIVEVADNSDIQEDLETAGSFPIPSIVSEDNLLHIDETPEKPKKVSKSNTSQSFKGIKKVAADPTDNKQDDGCDKKNETSKQGTPKRKSLQVSKEATSSESSKQSNRKRSLPLDDKDPEPSSKKNVKCGVCSKLLSEADWNRHVAKKHNYIAWKAGQSIDLDAPDLLKNLRQKFDTVGSLKCPMCYIQTTIFNKFIGHVKTCLNHKKSSSRRTSSSKDVVICGVCRQKVQYESWNEHIGKAHNYLAWIDGQDTLNLEEEAAVSKHLQSIIRSNGSLKCYKCGLNRKRVKLYLSHIETCDGSEAPMDDPSTSSDMNSTIHEVVEPSVPDEKILTCGVCNKKIPVLEWMEHIGKEHNYLAWKDGSTPLILDDEEEVRNHLQEFIRHSGGLRCYKCGLNRKRVKLYLSHIETCEGDGVNLDQSALEMSMDQSSSDEKTFECAVCKAKVSVLDWNEHIGREHHYIAWRVGATPLDINDQDAVKEHLQDIIRNCKGLVCYKCGLNRRRVSNYLSHIQTCDGSERHWDQSTSSNLDSTVISDQIDVSVDATEKNVKCGVCDQSVPETTWITHIGREHKYLAWQQGRDPLALDNEEEVKAHLLKISKKNNGLICYRCRVVKKYPKSFQHHVEDCKGVEILDDVTTTIEPEISLIDFSDVPGDTVTCGVCNKVVKKTAWIRHLVNDHDYMAWLQGRPPLDQKDRAMVQRHLIEVSRRTGGLKCKICGLVRKYAKTYIQHIEHCKQGGGRVEVAAIMAGIDSVSCAVCSEEVDPKDWRNHAMKKHYNVAWIVGATPIEINNPYGVEPYIKEYQLMHNNKLVCKTCGISRVSAVGFYAHIIICGKTEEEMDIYKNTCEICNNKYLRIYKSQHMTMHKEKELALERRLIKNELKKDEDEPVEIVGGRRRAAEKAKNVIEKYSSHKGDGKNCSSCGFSSEVEAEMLNHVCVAKLYEGSESDESVNTDYSSEEDDDDTDVDSNISDEEREARDKERTKSKKHREYSYRIQRLPYQIKNVISYMRKSAEEFAALHLTYEDLFSQYRNFDYEIVCETDLVNYMPPLEESCKIRYGDDDTWVTYKRFEARKEKDIITLFTGGCIQNMCWVPSSVGDHSPGPVQEYLSVLTSLAADKPRHAWNEKPAQQPALIQIWDCGNLLAGIPELVMGLALDCGTVWSIDWCPSGARDFFGSEECNETRRLGLCAAASANGSAYVFAVPHPATIKEKEQIFYKLKPVVELRLAMDTNRTVFQATAIKWSTQKGHEHIVVGYSNGTIAYFDIKNTSPLLKCTENNVDIVYPYHDERAQAMCIEDVDVFPVSNPRHSPVVVAGSVGGAGTRLLQAHAAAARVLFPPHWPAALLAGDDNLVSQAINELEWYGMGRRVGGLRTVCGCPWCGRIAAASAPLVRLMRTHPAYNDLHRQVIALLQMVPLSGKRKRKANDELSMVMEPLTYNEAILKYGLELKQITAKDKTTQQKLSGTPREAYPERFPLADVTAMAFCPTYKNHHKLAMATHAGVIFIINV